MVVWSFVANFYKRKKKKWQGMLMLKNLSFLQLAVGADVSHKDNEDGVTHRPLLVQHSAAQKPRKQFGVIQRIVVIFDSKKSLGIHLKYCFLVSTLTILVALAKQLALQFYPAFVNSALIFCDLCQKMFFISFPVSSGSSWSFLGFKHM